MALTVLENFSLIPHVIIVRLVTTANVYKEPYMGLYVINFNAPFQQCYNIRQSFISLFFHSKFSYRAYTFYLCFGLINL